jgi:hypothetical protein
MAGILKEAGAVKDYWLEPVSRRLEPKTLALTDSGGKPLEEMPYSPGAPPAGSISDGTSKGLLIDFGKEVGGYTHLKFASGDCEIVGVLAVESISQAEKKPRFAVPLLDVSSAYIYNSISPGRKGVTDLPHFGGFRYLWLYPESAGSFRLEEAYLDYTPYIPGDIDECGYFLCSDGLLNRTWFAGLHTIEMCTVDPALGVYGSTRIGEGDWVLIDGAKRDRLIWQSGYIPGCSPAPGLGRLVSGFFGEYVAWWVVVLYRYYLHTGDIDALKELFPIVRGAIDYLESQCRGGFFRQMPLNMLEWCFTVIRLGKPTHTNAMYYWALSGASFLARELGEDSLAAEYASRASGLGRAVKRELWDGARGAFVDTTVNRRRIPEDGNSIAIVSGLVKEPERSESILAYLKDKLWEDWGANNVDRPYYPVRTTFPWHNSRVMPFMNYYEALARFISGDDEGAMELVRRCWGHMVETEPGTTFWEWKGRRGGVEDNFCSLCHGWSAGVMPLLSQYVLGVRTEGVAYRTFRFDPHPVGLEWVEGRVPVKGGFIEARVEKKKDGYDTKVNAPEGMDQVS